MAVTQETPGLQAETPMREPVKLFEEMALETEEAHTAFVQRLLEQGAIPFVPEGRPGPPPRPVSVRGEPISQTIIDERR